MIQHASYPLSARDTQRIANHAALADAARFLHPVHQALLHRRGWLTMLAPQASGGAELPLPEVVRLEEAVAAIDGSVGWVLTLCAGAGWFAGFLTPDLAREIIGTRRVCLGASGAPMATHFTLNAVLRVDGQPLLDEHGAPRIRAFLVPAAQVQLIPSWNSIGMRASASHSYRVDEAWVSKEHGFTISAASAYADGPLYRYPFYSLAYVTLAANVAGMASHFMQLAQECIRHRRHAGQDLPLIEVPEVASLLRNKQQAFDTARAYFYTALDTSWA